MGKAIKKKWFGESSLPGSQIILTGKVSTSTPGACEIISQRKWNSYLVLDHTGKIGEVKLVNKSDINDLVDGEAFLLATDKDSNIYPVRKIAQKKLVIYKDQGYMTALWNNISADSKGEVEIIDIDDQPIIPAYILVTKVDENGAILEYEVISGGTGVRDDDVVDSTIGGSGSGAVFEIGYAEAGAGHDFSNTDAGTGYVVGDELEVVFKTGVIDLTTIPVNELRNDGLLVDVIVEEAGEYDFNLRLAVKDFHVQGPNLTMLHNNTVVTKRYLRYDSTQKTTELKNIVFGTHNVSAGTRVRIYINEMLNGNSSSLSYIGSNTDASSDNIPMLAENDLYTFDSTGAIIGTTPTASISQARILAPVPDTRNVGAVTDEGRTKTLWSDGNILSVDGSGDIFYNVAGPGTDNISETNVASLWRSFFVSAGRIYYSLTWSQYGRIRGVGYANVDGSGRTEYTTNGLQQLGPFYIFESWANGPVYLFRAGDRIYAVTEGGGDRYNDGQPDYAGKSAPVEADNPRLWEYDTSTDTWVNRSSEVPVPFTGGRRGNVLDAITVGKYAYVILASGSWTEYYQEETDSWPAQRINPGRVTDYKVFRVFNDQWDDVTSVFSPVVTFDKVLPKFSTVYDNKFAFTDQDDNIHLFQGDCDDQWVGGTQDGFVSNFSITPSNPF